MNTALSWQDIASIAPLLILLGTALGLLLVESLAEHWSKRFATLLTGIAFVIALIAALQAPASNNPLLTQWLRFDGFSRFFTLFFLIAGLGTVFLSATFFERFKATEGEYYFLLASSIFGLILIASAAGFLTLFLGLETLSIALYVLCGYMKKWTLSKEAALKYFFMGSLATAFLLYGIALIYGAIGFTRFTGMLEAYQHLTEASHQTLFISGAFLVTLGLFFKAAIVPFHMWAPDVYEGAATPVTAFMAIATKAGAFAALIRIFAEALPGFDAVWNQTVALFVYPTLIVANIIAMKQMQLRRFFAYSGIAHAGFLLIPLAAGTPDAISAMLFYLVVYGIATLGAFAVLALVDDKSDGVFAADLTGLFKRAPLSAAILSLCLLTLAGIPPTAGFFAKFYIFKIAFEAGYYGLLIVGLLMTLLSAYYYLRFIAVMMADAPENAQKVEKSMPAHLLGLTVLAAIIFVSVFPSPLLNLLSLPTF